MKLFSTLLLLAAIAVQFGCGGKNIQLEQDRLLIGEWALTNMIFGEENVKAEQQAIIYQFTADKQLIIKTSEKKESSSYAFSNHLLVVDDGNITRIKEKIEVKKLTKTTLVLSFKMDGKNAEMSFVRQSKVLN